MKTIPLNIHKIELIIIKLIYMINPFKINHSKIEVYSRENLVEILAIGLRRNEEKRRRDVICRDVRSATKM